MTCPGPDPPGPGLSRARDTVYVLYMSTSIRTRTLQASHPTPYTHTPHGGAQSRQTTHSSSSGTEGGERTCSSKGHTRIYSSGKSAGCMILNQLPSGHQQVTSSHPPIACQDIASHLPLPSRRRLLPFKLPFGCCARVRDRVGLGHTTLNVLYKNNSSAPPSPFTVLGVVLLFPHKPLSRL